MSRASEAEPTPLKLSYPESLALRSEPDESLKAGSIAMKAPAAWAAGNTVVIKPSELTPFTGELFMDLVEAAVRAPAGQEACARKWRNAPRAGPWTAGQA
jgi:hypothetical protein